MNLTEYQIVELLTAIEEVQRRYQRKYGEPIPPSPRSARRDEIDK